MHVSAKAPRVARWRRTVLVRARTAAASMAPEPSGAYKPSRLSGAVTAGKLSAACAARAYSMHVQTHTCNGQHGRRDKGWNPELEKED